MVKCQDTLLLTGQWWKFLSIIYMYPPWAYRSNRLDDTGHIYLRDLERSYEVKFFFGFWKTDINFPLMFHRNHMLISHHQEDIGDFHTHDLVMTLKGQSRSWSRWTVINLAIVNIFVSRHPERRSNRLDDTGHFHFRDPEMTSSKSSEVKFFGGFWKADMDFPIVSHSNHGSISHRLATIHECNRQTDRR